MAYPLGRPLKPYFLLALILHMHFEHPNLSFLVLLVLPFKPQCDVEQKLHLPVSSEFPVPAQLTVSLKNKRSSVSWTAPQIPKSFHTQQNTNNQFWGRTPNCHWFHHLCSLVPSPSQWLWSCLGVGLRRKLDLWGVLRVLEIDSNYRGQETADSGGQA